MINENWMTMKEAAKTLKVSPSKISRLAAIKAIQVREDIVDRRIKLVNLEEIRNLLNRNKK